MDITKRPKAASIDASTIAGAKRPPVQTLKDYFTEGETKNHRLSFLKDLARVSKSAKWKEFLQFVGSNLSGDLTTFSPENREKIDMIILQVDEKYESETTSS